VRLHHPFEALRLNVGMLFTDAILTQDDGPTTLRLSGQLMLGVTRIYSRKVQYLLDDCKETREKITLVRLTRNDSHPKVAVR